MMDSQEDYLSDELDKQRRRLKEIGTTLEQQHQMLRLIIQVDFFIEIKCFILKNKFCRKWKLKPKRTTSTKESRLMNSSHRSTKPMVEVRVAVGVRRKSARS